MSHLSPSILASLFLCTCATACVRLARQNLSSQHGLVQASGCPRHSHCLRFSHVFLSYLNRLCDNYSLASHSGLVTPHLLPGVLVGGKCNPSLGSSSRCIDVVAHSSICLEESISALLQRSSAVHAILKMLR